MVKKGDITAEEICVIAKSEPIPGSPLTYRADLKPETKAKIKDAILNAHNEIQVTGYGELTKYVEVAPSDYEVIRQMITSLNVPKELLLKP